MTFLSSTTITATPATKVTTTHASEIQKPIQINVTSNEKTITNILECIEDIEMYIILIFVQIIIALLIKLFKMCTKMYAKHNEIVIKKHNRISPNI